MSVLDAQSLPLETKVAQILMLGYEGSTPNPILKKLLGLGLGGIIFFRDNFQAFTQSTQITTLLSDLQTQVPLNLPRPFLSLDQEGGQVERLPCHLFPSLITPRAIALSKQPKPLAETVYETMAAHLAALGFNFNYFPTLDVNLEPQNPIIGVRAFGDDPKTVWELAKTALKPFSDHGIIAVGKHFPGHGNGTVDSHLKLPYLKFTETELQPFQNAIAAGLPAMLVSHGFYPDLQTDPAEFECPASASPSIIQKLLREKLQFQGLVVSDDMCMGAISVNPLQAAIRAFNAGIDILVYKQSTETEWAIYEGLLDAVKSGEISEARLDEAVNRILATKQLFKPHQTMPDPVPTWTSESVNQTADAIAEQAIGVLYRDQKTDLSFDTQMPILLLHPDRTTIVNYAYDIPLSEELPDLLKQQGFSNLTSVTYPVSKTPLTASSVDSLAVTPKAIVFVTFNPLIQPVQIDLYQALQNRFIDCPLIVVSAGTPYCRQVMPAACLHLSLCNYRPPSMRALAKYWGQAI